MLQGDRAHVAVSCFVVLSGFVTHWVYGRPERWDERLLRFYAHRLDRFVLTSWLGMIAIVVMELLSISYSGVGAAAQEIRLFRKVRICARCANPAHACVSRVAPANARNLPDASLAPQR